MRRMRGCMHHGMPRSMSMRHDEDGREHMRRNTRRNRGA